MDDSRSDSNDFDAQIFEAAVQERILAAVDQLPPERAATFHEDNAAGLVRIKAEFEQEGMVDYVVSDTAGEAVRVRIKEPST